MATSSAFSFHIRPLTGPRTGSNTSVGNVFGPRIGRLTLARSGLVDVAGSTSQIEIPTPNLWANTSRGVVSHLTRDNVMRSAPLAGVHLTLESYLENNPPIPTLVPGLLPLHTFHGFDPKQHLLSLGLRDPNDAQPLRANGNDYVIAQCARGSKQVIPQQFHSWATKLQPDIIFALPDIPYTPAPYSQRRLIKSNERSIRWLTDLVILREKERPCPPMTLAVSTPAIFAHLLGGSVLAARGAFAESLTEPLIGRYADLLPTLDSIDDAVDGYVLDLVPIRLSSAVSPEQPAHPRAPLPDVTMIPLIHASLQYLPEQKPRLATGASTPHEILHLIRSSGIDLFDSSWAQRAADHGVALDFRFPVGEVLWAGSQLGGVSRRSAALNLYNPCFATDFSRLSDHLMSAWDVHQTQRGKEIGELATENDVLVCRCIACSPETVPAPIVHSAPGISKVDSVDDEIESFSTPHGADTATTSSRPWQPPPRHFSRAYLHHLLHTHEMSAHTFLAAHNLAVLDAFFAGIRSTLVKSFDSEYLPSAGHGGAPASIFEKEIARFEHIYDESLLWGTAHLHSSYNTADTKPCHPGGSIFTGILEEAEKHWREVEYLRGKGRFKREKEAARAAVMGKSDSHTGSMY